MRELLKVCNKLIFIILIIPFCHQSCKNYSKIDNFYENEDSQRKIIVLQDNSTDIIPKVKLSFRRKKQTTNFETDDYPDTLLCNLANSKYYLRVSAVGYKDYIGTIKLSKHDKYITIKLKSIFTEDYPVEWSGGLVTIKDADGRLKRYKSSK